MDIYKSFGRMCLVSLYCVSMYSVLFTCMLEFVNFNIVLITKVLLPLIFTKLLFSQGISKKAKKGESLMCHQCQRNDKSGVVFCSSCNRKRYCYECIENW